LHVGGQLVDSPSQLVDLMFESLDFVAVLLLEVVKLFA